MDTYKRKPVTLHPITDAPGDRNRFCGPSVISALTGMTTGEAARLIRFQTRARKVTGTSSAEVIAALRACNLDVARQYKAPRGKGITLAAWLKETKTDRTPGRVFLIVAGWHWQLVTGRRYTCGRIRDIVSIRDKRVKRRARVSDVWEVRRLMSIKTMTDKPVTIPDVARKPKRPQDATAAKARRLAKKHGIDIEADGWGIVVWPPEVISEDGNDPFEGDHGADDWAAALSMVERYAAMTTPIT